MDKSSFQKLFRELYKVNPDQWNNLLNKAGKTVYSRNTKPRKIDRTSMASKAFENLMKINYNQFHDFGKKQNASVNRPKSIRINNSTLQQIRNQNNGNSKADVKFVDSSAIANFRLEDNHNGTKDVNITFKNGDGKEYLYPDVPVNVANGLYAAPSKGSYVANVISNYSDYSNPKVKAKIK